MFVLIATSCAVYEPGLLGGGNSPLAAGGASASNDAGDNDGAPGGSASSGAASGGAAGISMSEEDGGEQSAAGALGVGGDGAGGSLGASGAPSGGSAHGGAGRGGSGGAGRGGGSGQAGSMSGGTSQGGRGGAAQGGAAQAGSSGMGNAGTPGAVAPHDLSTGMKATSSTQETGNETPKGNDGNYATRWCGQDDLLPQWWRVDLGAPHTLNGFSVTFQFGDRSYSYVIETSPDDAVYTQRATVTGAGAVQTGAFPSAVTARYVRITINSAALSASGKKTWGSFYEFIVTGT